MEPLKCKKHRLSKDFIFCLDKGCDDRLVCKKCHVLDEKHSGHNFVMVEFFMQNDEDEFKRIFGENYVQDMKNVGSDDELI